MKPMLFRNVLTADECAELRQLTAVHEYRACHGGGGHTDGGHGGHGGDGQTVVYEPEDDDKDDDDKEDDKDHAHPKPHALQWLARTLDRALWRALPLGSCVDPACKVYRLVPGAGVPEHVDEDFAGPCDLRATLSVLVYLSDGHEGGDTYFRDYECEHARAGDVLVFPHAAVHGARPVIAGERFVLKTDIFTPRSIAQGAWEGR